MTCLSALPAVAANSHMDIFHTSLTGTTTSFQPESVLPHGVENLSDTFRSLVKGALPISEHKELSGWYSQPKFFAYFCRNCRSTCSVLWQNIFVLLQYNLTIHKSPHWLDRMQTLLHIQWQCRNSVSQNFAIQ